MAMADIQYVSDSYEDRIQQFQNNRVLQTFWLFFSKFVSISIMLILTANWYMWSNQRLWTKPPLLVPPFAFLFAPHVVIWVNTLFISVNFSKWLQTTSAKSWTSLLFLDKLKTIEIWETGNSKRTCLAMWTKSGVSSSRHYSSLPLVTYDSVLSDGDMEYSWRIVQTRSPENEAITRLSQLAGTDSVNYVVQRHKLRPDVRIAYPLTSRERMSGRLFTFLPLPSKTGFPVHVHALFALTSSRQSLRNPNETGIVQGSDSEWVQPIHPLGLR